MCLLYNTFCTQSLFIKRLGDLLIEFNIAWFRCFSICLTYLAIVYLKLYFVTFSYYCKHRMSKLCIYWLNNWINWILLIYCFVFISSLVLFLSFLCLRVEDGHILNKWLWTLMLELLSMYWVTLMKEHIQLHLASLFRRYDN